MTKKSALGKLTQFPIGFWNYCTMDMLGAAAVKDWAEAGMTVAMSPDFRPGKDQTADMGAILDAAEKENIKVILGDSRSYWRALKDGEEAYRRGFAQALTDFGGHPATLGFHAGDEPGSAEFDNACRAMRIQQEEAPQLTPFLNLLPWHEGAHERVGFSSWAAYLDAYVQKARPAFLCYDCYAQMNPLPECLEAKGGWEMYFINLREFHAAAQRHKIPFWTTLLSVGHFKYRCPTEDELRWQLNTAVAHGAKGILWFFFYMREPHDNYRLAPIDEHWERSETFAWLSRVNRSFLKWHAPVIHDLELRQAYHIGRSWAAFPASTANSKLLNWAKADQPLIVSEFADAKARDYVVVVNNSQTHSTLAEISVKGPCPQLFRVGWGGTEVPETKAKGNDFAIAQHWLAPGQMELYRVETSPG